MASRWAAVKLKPWATMLSWPLPPTICMAVPRSLTVNAVPIALVLVTVKPLTVVCDRSSVPLAVTSLLRVAEVAKPETPLAVALLIWTVAPFPYTVPILVSVFVVRS